MADRADLRLLHFADLHLGAQAGGRVDPATGLNQRVTDVCNRFDELCEAAEQDAVHAVLFAGDAFNNQHPDPTLQRLFATRIRRLRRAGAAVFLLVGNHDLPKMAARAHPFSIYEALEIEGVVVGDRAKVYRLPLGPDAPSSELQVAALPHFSRQDVHARHGDVDIDAAVASTVKALGEELDPALPAVFVGHCHVNQADIGDGQPRFSLSEVEVLLSALTIGHAFPYYALGHVHKKQVLQDDPFVAYPGSLERIDFGEGERVVVPLGGAVQRREADEKGFFRFDLARDAGWSLTTPPEFRAVRARSFVTVEADDLRDDDPAADLGERIDRARTNDVSFDDAIVRVRATIAPTDRARITPALARDLVPEAYDVRLALSVIESDLVRDPRFAERMTEIEALDKYLETRDDWADDHDELRRLGRELVHEVLVE
jgi:DNA repair protein SbcD/Mre11